MASKVHESTLVSFYVYNPQLGHKEGTVSAAHGRGVPARWNDHVT